MRRGFWVRFPAPLSSLPHRLMPQDLAPGIPFAGDRLLWFRRACPSTTLDESGFFFYSRLALPVPEAGEKTYSIVIT
jgi:hypothetical protein